MKKKLILIFPVDKSYIRFQAGAPPLALGIIAALTPENWDVEIIDENWEEFEYKDADLVGISSWTFFINRAYEIAGQYVKKGVPVVMGGMHVSVLPEEAIRFCDSVVIGLAEEVWPILINDFENLNLKQFYHGQPSEIFIKPRRDLFDKRYTKGILQTSRGCPMNCNFCSVKPFHGNKYIKRPIYEVMDDINEITHHFIIIVDENILGYSKNDEAKTMELFSKMADLKIKKYWYGFSTINIANNDDLLKKAADSGCGLLFIGIESENEETLSLMNKKVNKLIKEHTINQLVEKIQKAKIAVFAGFIYCAESDTISSIKKRTAFINKSSFDVIHISILTPFPGTKIYQNFKDSDRLYSQNYPEDWKYYNWKNLVFKPESQVDFSIYYKNILHYILKNYSPYQIITRAIRTYSRTKDLTITLHCMCTNIDYRNYYLNVNDSFLKRVYRLLSRLQKIFFL